MPASGRSSDFLEEFAKGRDPEYFAEHILGVRLNPAQQRYFRTALRTEDGYKWVFRRSVHVSGNQVGKTLGLAIAVLWMANYKIGIPNNDWDVWLNSSYNHHHLAPTYTQSLLLMNDMRNLMEGKHTAQFDKEKGQFRKVLWQKGLAIERKIDSTYYAFEMWNGAIVHFRSSDNKAKSLQGVRSHSISFDEAAFEDHLIEVIDQAVKLRLISTGGPLLMVSTPNGLNDYYQIVQDVMSVATQTGERTWEAPSKRSCLIWSHVSDNVGYGYSQDEVDFLEEDIDPATKDQQLRGAFLEPQDAFFVPVSDIEKAFVPLPNEAQPQNDHTYIVFWDISVKSDPTVCVIVDITSEPMKGVYYRRWEKPMPFRELVAEMERIHYFWSSPNRNVPGRPPSVLTGFDASSMGGVAVRQELGGITPLRPLQMGGSSRLKTEMLVNLRTLLATRRMVLPKGWTQMKREILSYRLDDDKLKQDSVMALTGAAKLATQGYTGSSRRAPFSTNVRTRMQTAFR
jgi:hypothetical protein